ncbi:protein of unknown function [Nitratireductor aquimarinus]
MNCYFGCDSCLGSVLRAGIIGCGLCPPLEACPQMALLEYSSDLGGVIDDFEIHTQDLAGLCGPGCVCGACGGSTCPGRQSFRYAVRWQQPLQRRAFRAAAEAC